MHSRGCVLKLRLVNICCYDNNNKVLFTTGKSKQLELLIDDDIVANIYSG